MLGPLVLERPLALMGVVARVTVVMAAMERVVVARRAMVVKARRW